MGWFGGLTLYPTLARGSVLSVTVVAESPELTIFCPPGALAPISSGPGDAPFEISVTGGYPPYSYAWQIIEEDDPGGLFTIADQGTINGPDYGDYTVNTIFTQPAPPAAPQPGTQETGQGAMMIVRCTVTDTKSQRFITDFGMEVHAV